MALNTQFSIAIHIMAGLGYCLDHDVTSTELAASVNTSPSFVRRVLAKLSKSGLVLTATGKNGACWLGRKPREISLLDIYRAVQAPKAFAIHTYAPQRPCAVSCGIKEALVRILNKTQKSMESRLARITLAEVISDLKKK